MRHYRVVHDEKWACYDVQGRFFGLWLNEAIGLGKDRAIEYAKFLHERSKRKGKTVVFRLPPPETTYGFGPRY